MRGKGSKAEAVGGIPIIEAVGLDEDKELIDV